MERAIKTTQCRSQYVNPMQHGTKTPTKLALHGSYQILYTLSKLPDRAQREFPLVAEALVMRAALQAVISLDITHLQMTSDNQTLIRAINDKLFEKESYGISRIDESSSLFVHLSFCFFPRAENEQADALAKLIFRNPNLVMVRPMG